MTKHENNGIILVQNRKDGCMKKILIISDTHNINCYACDAIEAVDRVDAIIHAGDYVRDARKLEEQYPMIPIYYVAGNNDIYSDAPKDLCCELFGKKFFITHGHYYSVKGEMQRDYPTLVSAAKEKGADVVVFGHTHTPYLGYNGDMTVLNPGSPTFGFSYAVCEIDGDKIKTQLMKL